MIRLKILFEDNWVAVVNKPSGLTVNKSEASGRGTLQEMLSLHFNLGESLGIGDRAGIVHRLDRETSGLLLVAKSEASFLNLQDQFKKRLVEKKYIALVHGFVKKEKDTVESKLVRIGKFGKFAVARRDDKFARDARTDYEVDMRLSLKEDKLEELINSRALTKARINYLRKQAKDYTLINVFPKTGRTHQIRVHLKSIGHAVVSDMIYAPKKLLSSDLFWCPRLFLHASYLAFIHPASGKEIAFALPLPNELKNAMLNLEVLDEAA